MTGLSVQAEVAAGLAQASSDFGTGSPLKAAIIRSTPVDETTWPPAAPADSAFVVTALISKFKQSDYANLNIETGDVMILVEAGVVEPLVTDKIKLSGQRYSVVTVSRIEPGGTALMYRVQARGGIPDTETYIEGVDIGSSAGLAIVPIANLPPLP